MAHRRRPKGNGQQASHPTGSDYTAGLPHCGIVDANKRVCMDKVRDEQVATLLLQEWPVIQHDEVHISADNAGSAHYSSLRNHLRSTWLTCANTRSNAAI